MRRHLSWIRIVTLCAITAVAGCKSNWSPT